MVQGRKKKPRKTYYACRDMDIEFQMREVEDFIYLWNEGHKFTDICRYIRGYNHDRTQNELAILIISLGEEGRIKPRKYGLWGK